MASKRFYQGPHTLAQLQVTLEVEATTKSSPQVPRVRPTFDQVLAIYAVIQKIEPSKLFLFILPAYCLSVNFLI